MWFYETPVQFISHFFVIHFSLKQTLLLLNFSGRKVVGSDFVLPLYFRIREWPHSHHPSADVWQPHSLAKCKQRMKAVVLHILMTIASGEALTWDTQCSWAWGKYILKPIFPCPWTCLLVFDECGCHNLLKGKRQDMLPKWRLFLMNNYNKDIAITRAACCFNSTDCTHGLDIYQLKQYVLLYRCLGFQNGGGFLQRLHLFVFVAWAHSH